MKKYLILLIILASFTSCENQLDTFPTSSVAADAAFRNEGDFSNAVRGAYRAMLSASYYGGDLQGFDVTTDNLLISQEGRFSQQYRHDWAYNPNSGFGGYLAQAYRVVQNANFILLNIDVLEDGDFKNNMKGEALAIRALAHFDIVRYFAKIPTQSSDAGASLAMPYVTVPDVNALPARITVTEYYTNLVLDLTEAAAIINADNGKFQMGKNAVNGILANVYLHMGKYQDAANAANAVTAAVGTRANFVGIWNDTQTDGVIFNLQNDNTSNVTLGVPYNQTAGGIKDEYVPDYAFFQQYAANDIRKTAYFETSLFAGNNYNHVKKWYSSTTTTSLGVVDAKVLRASEVQLIKAEALSEIAGQDVAARAALDLVRSQRYTGFTVGTEVGSALKEAIAKERRLELAFEGSRFSDLKRKGLAIARSDFGHFADGSGVSAVNKTLAAGDFRFQAPIPVGEMNLNPNMVQNPGYGN
jgi:starch-binding outer membrane protein, SusD/RagB family